MDVVGVGARRQQRMNEGGRPGWLPGSRVRKQTNAHRATSRHQKRVATTLPQVRKQVQPKQQSGGRFDRFGARRRTHRIWPGVIRFTKKNRSTYSCYQMTGRRRGFMVSCGRTDTSLYENDPKMLLPHKMASHALLCCGAHARNIVNLRRAQVNFGNTWRWHKNGMRGAFPRKSKFKILGEKPLLKGRYLWKPMLIATIESLSSRNTTKVKG